MITHSHPALTLSAPLMEYCNRFLKKHNLNYFQIIKVHQDGSTLLLTNRADFTHFAIQHSVKNNAPLIYSCPTKEVLGPSSYWFLWEPNLPVAPVSMVRNEFDITNGLTFVERFPTHYYMIAFAAPHTNHGILDFYVNNIDLLRNFIQNFKEEQQSLLQTLESKPLLLPKPLQDENLSEMLLQSPIKSKQRIPVFFEGHESYVTLKEYECISLLPLGLSSKQIGQHLNISHRTVEEYFDRVKLRTGCKSKRDLIQLLN